MKIISCFFAICTSLITVQGERPADDFCGIKNTSTQNGEEIRYAVFYAVAGIYVHAGDASFTNTLEKLNGKPVYHVAGAGASYPSYDWVFKVRDSYESYIDTATMQPLKFVRKVQEGKYRKYENISFDRNANTATTTKKIFKVPPCIQDVMSSVYYARNIDFNKYKKDDRIPFKMFLDDEVHDLYIRYLGKEEIETKFGTFKAIKFKPLLVEGTLFKGGEQMNVWVTDDANHIPVRIESPIIVGSIKVDMSGYKNLRNPMKR